jgi:hypothetical protein
VQFLVVFDRSEVRPEVVLADSRRRNANLKSPNDSRLRFPIGVSATFIIFFHLPFTCFRRFLPLQIDTGSSFGR